MPDKASTTRADDAKGQSPVLQKSKTVEEYAAEFEHLMEVELPVSLGFSARLNMLWDLAGAAPPD